MRVPSQMGSCQIKAKEKKRSEVVVGGGGGGAGNSVWEGGSKTRGLPPHSLLIRLFCACKTTATKTTTTTKQKQQQI